jgi:hypothetical protein
MGTCEELEREYSRLTAAPRVSGPDAHCSIDITNSDIPELLIELLKRPGLVGILDVSANV